ncbi:LytTR family transcriptional regulator DNA-binding domain-containing protein [Adhaeribacter pallidiroseus]|uniref:HTH LytTR-type domain-containing protein n=1 Tax=Adhaeribacter pallidiroseus TaxID=2072847 RepID=A0A369QKR9_9BACT|nr:LytTR family DNA-binding domain-containing protein [Adhaeribacter pallidiroseus]RDC65491.1 hypothetical protein AHMF7616_04121 [Adhaeribacter pallidiroseus]
MPHQFIRTHQNHLVNPASVKSWLKENGGALLLYNGSCIPVARQHR